MFIWSLTDIVKHFMKWVYHNIPDFHIFGLAWLRSALVHSRLLIATISLFRIHFEQRKCIVSCSENDIDLVRCHLPCVLYKKNFVQLKLNLKVSMILKLGFWTMNIRNFRIFSKFYLQTFLDDTFVAFTILGLKIPPNSSSCRINLAQSWAKKPIFRM